MELATRGEVRVQQLKAHVLEVMQDLPDCGPEGTGAGVAAIEQHAGLALLSDKQDHGFCRAILQALNHEGKIIEVGPRWKRRYRLL
jgi:hypothetical protein